MSELELRPDYQYLPDDRSRLVNDEERGRPCSQPRCRNEAVIVFNRIVYASGGRRTRRWFCCPEHSYGRRIENGRVLLLTYVPIKEGL